ncbi:hypothetical protein GCM10025868_27600 [Angustibacter aerolatus]|uniref:HTH deoR-type domain-containing protein n=1 Tax=Angustibacter aerolatus TaxID=1162965 RepID=A0ABQ6JH25_9ACTN|nr:hypothetical protein GCM10025868_27600 [Angustibacter aerolatus]
MLTMLEILQRGGVHQVGDLAARLGVDERTVRRYVLHLLDLDVPVQSLRGRHGGYVIAPGYRVPPLMLTDDEALATVLGLVTRTSTEAVEAASAAGSALAKLRRVLPKQPARTPGRPPRGDRDHRRRAARSRARRRGAAPGSPRRRSTGTWST